MKYSRIYPNLDQPWLMRESALRAMLDSFKADVPGDLADSTEVTDEIVVSGTIGVIHIDGPIYKYPNLWMLLDGGTSSALTLQSFRSLEANPGIDGILMVIDSPGGELSGTADLADAIRDSTKPVYCQINDSGCSAAYWIASQADKVYANRTAFVGSIGVYQVIYDTSKMYESIGVAAHLIKSGENKGVGADGIPITPDQLKAMQESIDDIASIFVTSVADGRGMTPEAVKTLATGDAWIAEKALAAGLLDGIASESETIRQMQEEIAAQKITQVNKGKLGGAMEMKGMENTTIVATAEQAPAIQAPAEPAIKIEDVRNSEITRLDEVVRACGGNLELGMAQFKAGADANTAKLAYAETLIKENEALKAQVAKPKSGAQPVPFEATSTDANDPESMWSANVGDCQSKFSKKENFVAFVNKNNKK